jgi:DNA-binding NarL/FixJ family response regulator
MTVRILIADDHVIFLQGLRALLEAEPNMQVIGECRDGIEAVKATRKLKPDLVIMDTQMPGGNGIEATVRITTETPDKKVLCLSMYNSPRFVERALDAGASGYLLKDCAFRELAGAIREIMADRTYLSPAIAGIVVDAMKRRKFSSKSPSQFALLTKREREVLQLLAEGFSAKEIGERLCLSIKTVATHRQHVMDKLVIHNIAGLTKYAIREGLTSDLPQEHAPH